MRTGEGNRIEIDYENKDINGTNNKKTDEM